MTLPQLSLKVIYERMAVGETFVFLDVRSKSQFQNWLIKGQSLQAINVPYYDFLEDQLNIDVFPAHCTVVMIDEQVDEAKKMGSRIVAKGYDVAILQGGYETWQDAYVQAQVLAGPAFTLTQFHRLATGCLSYLLVTGGRAIVVDPSRHIEQYLVAVEREHAKITQIIDTHLHGDHLSGALALLRETKAAYLIPQSEQHTHEWEKLKSGTSRLGSVDMRVILLEDKGETLGNALLECNHQFVLSGNTVMVGEIGLPDMPGRAADWAEKLLHTVLQHVNYLADDTLILPAHFAAIQAVHAGGYIGATLGQIRKGVRLVVTENGITFANQAHGLISSLPPISEDIRLINAGLASLDGVLASTLEAAIRE